MKVKQEDLLRSNSLKILKKEVKELKEGPNDKVEEESETASSAKEILILCKKYDSVLKTEAGLQTHETTKHTTVLLCVYKKILILKVKVI